VIAEGNSVVLLTEKAFRVRLISSWAVEGNISVNVNAVSQVGCSSSTGSRSSSFEEKVKEFGKVS
jgi:hypothetical protein